MPLILVLVVLCVWETLKFTKTISSLIYPNIQVKAKYKFNSGNNNVKRNPLELSGTKNKDTKKHNKLSTHFKCVQNDVLSFCLILF